MLLLLTITNPVGMATTLCLKDTKSGTPGGEHTFTSVKDGLVNTRTVPARQKLSSLARTSVNSSKIPMTTWVIFRIGIQVRL